MTKKVNNSNSVTGEKLWGRHDLFCFLTWPLFCQHDPFTLNWKKTVQGLTFNPLLKVSPDPGVIRGPSNSSASSSDWSSSFFFFFFVGSLGFFKRESSSGCLISVKKENRWIKRNTFYIVCLTYFKIWICHFLLRMCLNSSRHGYHMEDWCT
jgi:hypothetical protein